ncbi:MAG: pyridoxal phosphate-dependent aminotransferase [Thermoanaerobaculia bacterium]
MIPAKRLAGIELSLIRQINALATPLSTNLGIGEPNLEPDERLREMAARAARAPWQYSPNAGTLALRRLICEGTPFDPKSDACVTAGTQEALFAIFTAFVNPGDEVLIPNPGFVSYATLATMCGAVVKSYKLDPPDWELEANAVIAAFTSRTKLVIINSPSNPLGAVAKEEALRRIAGEAAERDILVVSDEVYREIWYDAPPATMAGMSANVIALNGLSKSHGATGLRLGWALASAELIKPLVTAHQYIATCASVFSQALAEEILGAPAWNAEWLESARAQFRRQREAALYAIEHEIGVPMTPPAGAFYAFAPVPSCATLDFAKALATEAAVLVIPGAAFGSRGEGFIRISFAATVEQIGTGIERIGRWLTTREGGL